MALPVVRWNAEQMSRKTRQVLENDFGPLLMTSSVANQCTLEYPQKRAEYLMMVRRLLTCLLSLSSVAFPCAAFGQNVTIVGVRNLTGTVESISGNTLRMVNADGAQEVLFAKPDKPSIALKKGGINLRFTTRIMVSGKVSATTLQPGQTIRFTANISKPGRIQGTADKLQLLGDPDAILEVHPSRTATNSTDFVACDVTAKVSLLRGSNLNLAVKRQPFAPTGKLRLRLEKNCLLSVTEKSLDRVAKGDQVVAIRIADLNTGDSVAESIDIKLLAKNSVTTTSSPSRSKTTAKADRFDPSHYLKYSDQPGKPRDLRSENFLLHTDLSDRSAKILLDKLEYMGGMIARYYGRRQQGLVECYVVKRLDLWKDISLEPAGVAKIRERAGVTISRSLGKKRKSIVYACDDHGVVQHEAVHAFCSQTFGGTGPTWYSEGMAEMGQYWKKDNLAVEIQPAVIGYLTSSQPKSMLNIVAAGQITGDSWQAYAWRWALCHLLANNPNYAARFKALGLNMMSGGSATFKTVYGDVAPQISFEYDQFVKHFGNGYRVDLCVWDWNTQAKPLSGPRKNRCTVDAQKGWQATGLRVKAGQSYSYQSAGQWTTSKSAGACNAGGNPSGEGKLIGVVFNNFRLSDVIQLGDRGKWQAEVDGHLFVRCQDEFVRLADNSGKIALEFTRSSD